MIDKKRKAILCIDCQNDFITGRLKVNNAESIMNGLSDFLHANDDEYLLKIFTTDWHPLNHMSFKENGGEWPLHCLQYSEGAAIWFPLIKEAFSTKGLNLVLKKGDSCAHEEHSIFDNFRSCQKIKEMFDAYHIDELHICGLAREYCVKNSILGAIQAFGSDKIVVLDNYIGTMQDENALTDIIEKFNLKVIKD